MMRMRELRREVMPPRVRREGARRDSTIDHAIAHVAIGVGGFCVAWLAKLVVLLCG